MNLSQVLQGIPYEKGIKYNEDTEISTVRIDSRLVQKGDVFVALSKGREDGHDYISDAVCRGAVAIICERAVENLKVAQIIVKDTRTALSCMAANFYGNPQKRLKIIGVTGTNGKTTTCHFLWKIIAKSGKKAGLIGTLGAKFDDKQSSDGMTTPDPMSLFSLLADMANDGAEYVVMEVSAHAIYYNKENAIHYTACIFTNCTQDHLDFFKTMERYAAVKRSLFEGDRCGIAVLNADDPVCLETGKKSKKVEYYATHSTCKNTASEFVQRESGAEFSLTLGESRAEKVKIKLPGEYNIENALAAATCAKALGFSMQNVLAGLRALDGVEGRLQKVASVNGGDVYVDFAHTPDALERVLKTVRSFKKGSLFCVFGCGGNRDVEKRPLMGEVAAKYADFSVITSDNPRYEEPYFIIAAIEKGYRKHSRSYVVVQDRKKALDYAVRRMRKGDVLLVAGKGGENYQEIMGVKYDYSDAETVREIVKAVEEE